MKIVRIPYKTIQQRICKHLSLLLAGGTIYCIIEVLWRGYTHVSMFFVGGLCFVLIGMLNEVYAWSKMALISQMFLSSLTVTLIELLTGLIVNVWLKLDVWDYSHTPYNLFGQVCLLYTNLWFFLSLPAILLDDFLRWVWYREEKPRYKIL